MKLATGLLTDLLEIVEKTVDTKKSDGGLAVLLEPGATTLVGGGKIAEGAKLGDVVKRIAGLASADNPGIASALKLDAETHEGVTFHVITAPVSDPEAAKAFGPTVDLVVGIGPDRVYAAVGERMQSLRSSRSSTARSRRPAKPSRP